MKKIIILLISLGLTLLSACNSGSGSINTVGYNKADKHNIYDDSEIIYESRPDFGDRAYLTYGNTPLLFPIDKSKSDAVIVTNHGTKTATNLDFTLDSNANFRLDNSGQNSCVNMKELSAGASCKLVYMHVLTSKSSFVKQKISYNNGLNSILEDEFYIYTTQASYVTLSKASVPVIKNGESFGFEVYLNGNSPTTVTPALDTNNPYGYDTAVITPPSCTLSATNPSCKFSVTPLRLDGQVMAANGYAVGQINIQTTNGVLFRGSKSALYSVDNNSIPDTPGNHYTLIWNKDNIDKQFEISNYIYDKVLAGNSYPNIAANTEDFYPTGANTWAQYEQCKNEVTWADYNHCYKYGMFKFKQSGTDTIYNIRFIMERFNGGVPRPITNAVSSQSNILPIFIFLPDASDFNSLPNGTYTATLYLSLKVNNKNNVVGQMRVDLVVQKYP